ncbi:RANBP9 [Bugula neritina]|uniref:RANBP9 n=1 Tax=Bugula neritina TaxID=10212 RepID=A0A7J7KJ35_BUGNE|nr:RANBP9 [Bugula neritina]
MSLLQKGMAALSNKNSRLKQLYPAVNELETPFPTCWSHKDKHEFIGLSEDGLTINYKGLGKIPKDAASIRTNYPIPPSCGIYYFEVKIISKGRDGYMGIGLSGADVSNNRLPGWENNSYGYHGDDGHSFSCSGHGEPYGPTFTTNDVIGCCVNLIDGTCFFTKNGVNLGAAFKNISYGMYPTVGLQTPGEIVQANFGKEPFLFDIEDYMQEYKVAVETQIGGMSLEQNNDLWQAILNRIVSSYLVHYGYSATAESFAKDTGQEYWAEELASIKNRQRIQKLVLGGNIGEAISVTQELYPGLLESRPNLFFVLKCRQFVEMVNGTDTEIQSKKGKRCISSHSSAKSSPCVSPYSYKSSRNTSAANSPHRPSMGSPLSTHSNGAVAAHSSDVTPNGTSVLNGSVPMSTANGTVNVSEVNGNSHATGDGGDGMNDNMDVDLPRSHVSHIQSTSEINLIKILQFGKELKSMNTMLSETRGTNEENDLMLEGIFSLLAYSDPWNSPIGSQLDPLQREPVCAALNSAILEIHGLPPLPVLETILGQTKQTLAEMTKAGIGASAFAQLTNFIHVETAQSNT